MLKMYNRAAVAAGFDPEFWEESWHTSIDNPFTRALSDPRVCENDPLYPLVMATIRPDRLFLEGGCGQAQWVKYLSDRGQPCLGIDFAERTIAEVKRIAPELDVRVGNILALPLADRSVHTYFSNGVVEHFESGPEPALVEARRVVADDGWFLCSVPDQSLLREILVRGDGSELVRRVDGTREEQAPEGQHFFQYAFSEAEFRTRLEAAGFVVERTFGYAILWGLMEIPGLESLVNGATALRRRIAKFRGAVGAAGSDGANAAAGAGATGATADAAAAGATATATTAGAATAGAATAAAATVGATAAAARPDEGVLRRALVREDPTTPLVGPLVRVVRQYCANMRMFVARPRAR